MARRHSRCPMPWRDAAAETLAGAMPFVASVVLFVASVAYLLCGCSSYRGGRIVEGTDVAVGLSFPQSGGTVQIDALNFLTGFRFAFAEDAGVKCTYVTTNSVSAFGVYSSTTVKSVSVELDPTIDEADEP